MKSAYQHKQVDIYFKAITSERRKVGDEQKVCQELTANLQVIYHSARRISEENYPDVKRWRWNSV